MRRIGVPGIAFVLAAVLTGCPGTPPEGYWPPRVDSSQASPDPVRPGETVTLVVAASDDVAIVSSFARALVTPTGNSLSVAGECTHELAPQGDFKNVLITLACPVPEFASSGTWQMEIRINDGAPLQNLPGLTARVPFEVVDGSDDRSAPQLLSSTIEPSVVDQVTVFQVRALVRDETSVSLAHPNFAFVKPFAPNSFFECLGPTLTPVSPTDVEIVATCYPSNGRSEVGTHQTGLPLRDALGHQGLGLITLDVQSAP